MIFYDKIGDDFVLKEIDDHTMKESEIYRGKTVTILFSSHFDKNCFYLHAHGSRDTAASKMKEIGDNFVQSGFPEVVQSMYMVTLENPTVDNLNNTLLRDKMVSLFLIKEEINPSNFKCYPNGNYENAIDKRIKLETARIHQEDHDSFEFWGCCKKEPCLTTTKNILDNTKER